MRAAALQKAQLDAPGLHAAAFFDLVRQVNRQAAQLGMAEGVGAALGGIFADEGAFLVLDALADGHEHIALLLDDRLAALQEGLQIKDLLRQIDQVRTGTEAARQGSRPCQPTGVTAHDLHHRGGGVVIDGGVQGDLHAAGGDILRRRAEAGAVVGAEQVVVDGLGDAHDPTFPSGPAHVAAHLLTGVHAVVAAVIEEIADVVFLEDFQDAPIILLVLVRVRQLVAAGAQGRGGGVH